MTGKTCRFQYFKQLPLQKAGLLLIMLIAILLLWTGNLTSNQATAAIPAQIRFEGQYRIADGPWQPIAEGKHIPATKGDVTLRGNFHMYAPDGEYVGLFTEDTLLAFYTDHIGITVRQDTNDPYVLDS